MSQRLRVCIDNRLPELDRLRSEVEGFLDRCGVSGKQAYHIQLALDELATNVISYAYDAQGGQGIDIDLACGEGCVDLTLVDTGKPFNPLQVPEPDLSVPPEERRVGGLGIHFVRKTMDELSYRREDGRNIVCLRKKTT